MVPPTVRPHLSCRTWYTLPSVQVLGVVWPVEPGRAEDQQSPDSMRANMTEGRRRPSIVLGATFSRPVIVGVRASGLRRAHLSKHPGYRIAFALALALGQWSGAAGAAGFIREDLRVSMPAADPRGLEALLVRADEPGRHPLVLINHGPPRAASQRPEVTPLQPPPHAIEFAPPRWAPVAVL